MTNLIRSNFQDHPFHLVTPSPWPLFTSVSLFSLATSGALSMHNFNNGYYLNYIAFFLVVLVMSFWFRDIISEATYIGDHTLAVQKGLSLGIILFIVSEALFFVAIFWAFLHTGLIPTVELGVYFVPGGGTKPLPPIFNPGPELGGLDVATAVAVNLIMLAKLWWDLRPNISIDLPPISFRLADGSYRRAVAYLGDCPVSLGIFLFLYCLDPRVTRATNTCPYDGRHYPLFYANNINTYPPLQCVPLSPPFLNDGQLDYHISTSFPSPLRSNWLFISGLWRLTLTTGYDSFEKEIRPNIFNLFNMELRSYNSIYSTPTDQY